MFGKKKEFGEPGVEESITDVQKELSNHREESAKAIEKATGMAGYLDIGSEIVNGKNCHSLKGELKGHAIKLLSSENYDDFSGTIDGKEITQTDVSRLWDKFYSMAYGRRYEAERLENEVRVLNKKEEDGKIRQETGSIMDDLLK